ncbi:MAG: tetratricopeptide repeat protein [Thermoanaerobaculia bacterium]
MTKSIIDRAIEETRAEEYLRALTLFLDVYDNEAVPSIKSPRDANALSYFGLCLAMVHRKFKEGVELCKRALDLEFYNGDHYANLARIYLAGNNRKKALETVQAGLRVSPENNDLIKLRKQMGVRARPTVPFLDRSHPINVSLGQVRHARKAPSKKK